MKKLRTICIILLLSLLAGCGATASDSSVSGGSASADAAGLPDYSKVASDSDYSEPEELDTNGLEPVLPSALNDGEYLIELESSSSMFRVADCLLVVADGSMKAKLRIESDSYKFMFAGTAAEAAASPRTSFIDFANNDAGDQIYTVPVEALDKPLNYASFSRKKEQWYDRTLVFLSSSLPDEAFKEKRYNTASDLGIEDGSYYVDVTLTGGTGRASVDSPALLMIEGGEAYAMITWSSSHYDYMIVEGERIDTEIVDDHSTFVIPVKGFDYEMPVVADTTAMSTPHEIEYTLRFDSATICLADPGDTATSYRNLKPGETITPAYATGFTVNAYDDGIYEVAVDKDKYLFVPKKSLLPSGIPESVTVIRTPVSHAYVASTSSMDFFTNLDALSEASFASQEDSKWADSRVSSLVKDGTISYIGKYDAPDYEGLLKGNADVAVENSMIYHSPETKEKLEELNIPVFVDLTSYEADPRGRVEWIKLYGIMTGKYDEAVSFFDRTVKEIDETEFDSAASSASHPKIAYFYISPKGHVGVRNSNDYISKMIEIAGGEYVPQDAKTAAKKDDNTTSTVDMSMEDFYLKAKDADILIYNSTIYGSPGSVDALVKDTAILSEFEAVKNGRVYATKDDMFQAVCAASDIISELHGIVSGKDGSMKYFEVLK